MAVTKVWERWEGRGGTTDENGVRTLKRQWSVITDDDLTWEPQVVDGVIAHDGSAALYSPHPAWAWAVCRKITPKPDKSARTWLVDAEYSSAKFEARGDGSGTGGNTTSPSPEQSNSTPANERPPSVTVAGKEITKPLEKDAVTGNRVLNEGVGDPFNPPPEVFRNHELITWKFFRLPADLNWTDRGAFRNSINDAPVTVLGRTYPTKTLRCTSYDVGTVWETGEAGLTLFFEFTVQAEYDPDTWVPAILNTGRRKRVPAVGGQPARLVEIVDQAGQPVADPVPLDEFGVPVTPETDYHYVRPNGYVPKSWATLLA